MIWLYICVMIKLYIYVQNIDRYRLLKNYWSSLEYAERASQSQIPNGELSFYAERIKVY